MLFQVNRINKNYSLENINKNKKKFYIKKIVKISFSSNKNLFCLNFYNFKKHF